MKVQRGRFPGTFKGWEEVQLAGPGPPVREGDERKGLEKGVPASDHTGLEHAAVTCTASPGGELQEGRDGEAMFWTSPSLLPSGERPGKAGMVQL